ncbi:methionyl-tRNA synthetase [Monoraphidium neglectum]|uniref:Methionyl-tRNA synthetase n=1 Tax=Monoraphidium neglectum TaxID=145388 RepID=A0A0D2LBU7_9CHLO|nr:methionyl-tRNA synthetase [Monoraphidium neglectum]KIZ04199.1 methionyl-tRNA synthetase [Monoraphidium neglectum]|eukprot:XP_013903218.1 methionyl-tRNA synthetase [Monoraphidium neglectum]
MALGRAACLRALRFKRVAAARRNAAWAASAARSRRGPAPAACLHHAASDAPGSPYTITTPLYYVNAVPHMGSAYPTIAADVLARFHRMRGREVRFLTGTDEHGEKIALAAAARGLSPQEHCDSIAREYEALWAKLDISYDSFVRTTAPHHEALVGEVLQRVWDKTWLLCRCL